MALIKLFFLFLTIFLHIFSPTLNQNKLECLFLDKYFSLNAKSLLKSKVLHLGRLLPYSQIVYPVGYLTNLATPPEAIRASSLPTSLLFWPIGLISQDHCLGSLPLYILGSAELDWTNHWCPHQSIFWCQNVFTCT